jgi:hypothetical protein
MMRHASIACSSAWLMRFVLTLGPWGIALQGQPGIRGWTSGTSGGGHSSTVAVFFFVKKVKNCDSFIRVRTSGGKFAVEWRKIHASQGIIRPHHWNDSRRSSVTGTGCQLDVCVCDEREVDLCQQVVQVVLHPITTLLHCKQCESERASTRWVWLDVWVSVRQAWNSSRALRSTMRTWSDA